jgi:serine/threonine protein kinase/Tol biopolymer transport system component
MPLVPGAKLGTHEIVEPLGAGGMGEVYRARDTRLGRDVALKVLPQAFARDRERMARFDREAKILASLNHPNIASLYGLEESNSTPALVMELVEGPTLAERIKEGGIPLEETLGIAKQICEGLEYAHERGVIHRDLKPANVKIAPDGAVKLLDFGLAKGLDRDAPDRDISDSPTMSSPTQAGIILGTAPYMSPEQAKGRPVDRRTDIWAFGCVLYEMLTGRRAFDGETVTDVLAAVVRAEPEWSALPTNTPDRVHELVRRCLRKDPRQRLQAIGDARIAIDEAPDATEAPGRARVLPSKPSRRPLLWIGAPLLAAVAAISGYRARSPSPPQTLISEITVPPGTSFVYKLNFGGPPALSPDGRRMAFVAVCPDGQLRVWVRPLNADAAQPLEGTEGASFPFWSPDGHSLGFFANGSLDRIDAAGGQAIAVAQAPQGRGGSWGSDGTLLYAPGATDGLYRVAASGGSPQEVTKLSNARLETTHRWPQFLPDGKHFLFFARSGADQASATYAASLGGGEPKLLVLADASAVYAPPGYLLFVRRGTLMAQRFDESHLNVVGDAMPLAKNVEADLVVWNRAFAVSENGVLVYHKEPAAGEKNRLAWFDRTGKHIADTGAPGEYGTLNLSPDGNRLVVAEREEAGNLNLWVYDLLRGIPTRLTFENSHSNGQPSWAADGKSIGFMSDRGGGGQLHLYEKPADGTGTTSPLFVDDASENLPSFSSDGRYLIFERQTAQAGSYHREIWALPLFGDRKAFPLVQNREFDLRHPALSVDGRWLAYVSAESGRPEVYVVPFLQGSGRWLVSTAGGHFPRWRHDGRELFYLSLDNKIVSAEMGAQGTSLLIGKVTPLFQASPGGSVGWPYDVSSDGAKFVVNTQATSRTAEPLTLVVNWPGLLKKE